MHFVDEQLDHGPIVLQRAVPVLDGDTVDTLAARILEQEHRAYPEALRRLLAAVAPRRQALCIGYRLGGDRPTKPVICGFGLSIP